MDYSLYFNLFDVSIKRLFVRLGFYAGDISLAVTQVPEEWGDIKLINSKVIYYHQLFNYKLGGRDSSPEVQAPIFTTTRVTCYLGDQFFYFIIFVTFPTCLINTDFHYVNH